MLNVILLKSLEAGFTSFRDLEKIVETCADQYGVDSIIPNKLITHYNHTNNFNTILRCLSSNKNIIKINRSEYNLTPEGRNDVKTLFIDDCYSIIIHNTEKELDFLIKHAEKTMAEAALHPIRIKYYKDGELISEITNELKNYIYFYHIDDNKLKLIIFGIKTLPLNSFLYQDDIVLCLEKDKLRFRDL